MFRRFSGAVIRRVIDRSHSCVPEHAHDWPVLSLFVIGSYVNETELGRRYICGPSAVLYRAGAGHRNTTAAVGFEQIEIEFDPSWLGRPLIGERPVRLWAGGRIGREARRLGRACQEEPSEDSLRAAILKFLEGAGRERQREVAGWIGAMSRRVRQDPSLTIGEMAHEVRRHPSWAGLAYRDASGEGLAETAARLRVEGATRLLRETDEPLSSIALAAGFCDQSHMNRSFRRVLGRAPTAVRAERPYFRQLQAGG
jgi:AraC family transcriptional regulator